MSTESSDFSGTREICQFLNLTYRELKKMERDGVIKRSGQSKWPTEETIRNIAFYWRDKAEDDRVISERARQLKAKADIEEMKAAVMAGGLVKYDEVMDEVKDEILQIRSAVLSKIPRAIALAAIPATAREREILFRDITKREIEIIADGDKKDGKSSPARNPRTTKPTSRKNSKPVGRRKQVS